MKQFALFFILAIAPMVAIAQAPLTKYWVQFADKKDSPFSIERPTEFLSERAVERRQKYKIAITEQDLPVNPAYLNALRAVGAKIYTTSKWFNAATIYAPDSVLSKVEALSFVKNTEPTGRYRKKSPKRTRPKNRDYNNNYPKENDPYGAGRNQIEMLNGDILHRMGYDGSGMMVAVLDGGFTNVDIMPFFDTLRANNRLLTSADFVDNDDYAYESSSHGSQVLSTMASNLPGMFIGTAPGATYVCVKTEEIGSELPIEEDNFVAGLEFADSLGADVVNSSLGYTTFDVRSMNHRYKDMNGTTSRASIGTDIAFEKGILVVVSAGNEGNGRWKYIGVPADATNALAVGATDSFGDRVSFSSQGPTFDGRIKPEVMARGGRTAVASLYSYKVSASDGTSFASPVMAGMVTSLWQAFPEKSNKEIKTAIEQSGDNYNAPDNQNGYGVPNFYKAYQILSGDDAAQSQKVDRAGMVERGCADILLQVKGKKTVNP